MQENNLLYIIITAVVISGVLILKTLPSLRGRLRRYFVKEKRRQTDHLRNSDSQTQRRYAHAVSLIERGQVVEGAHELEAIGLQRPAIDALEKAGLIREAAEVLIRLDRPNRAGVVCARNGRYLDAAHYYLKANMPSEAADCLVLTGSHDPNLFAQAAQLYQKAGKLEEALRSLVKAGKLDSFWTLALRSEQWELLDAILGQAELVTFFGDKSSREIAKKIDLFPLRKETIPLLSKWSERHLTVKFLKVILLRISADRVFCKIYWENLSSKVAAHLVDSLINSAPSQNVEERKPLLAQARGLYDAERFWLSGKMYEHLERWQMASRCYVSAGNLRKVNEIIDRIKDNALADALLQAVETNDTELAKKAVAGVDPDVDELQDASPFALTS